MDLNKLVFICVDGQKDFFDNDGSFYIKGSESIRGNLSKITELAKSFRIKVINTMSWRTKDSAGIADEPDFIETFPKHCLMETEGSRFIEEVRPNPGETMLIDWEPSRGMNFHNMHNHRNLIIRKNHFDLFEGNTFSEAIINNLGIPFLDRPTFVVYGVPTDLSVKPLVEGIARRGYKVYLVSDCVVGQGDNGPIVEEWENNNVVESILTKELIKKFE